MEAITDLHFFVVSQKNLASCQQYPKHFYDTALTFFDSLVVYLPLLQIVTALMIHASLRSLTHYTFFKY